LTSTGRLYAHAITAGQSADIRWTPRLLRLMGQEVRTVVADRAYDSDAFLGGLAAQGVTAVIPPRRHRRCQRQFSRHLYGDRHVVENYFARLKHFRRVATRYDKRVATWRGFVQAANLVAGMQCAISRLSGDF
jgi:transposase